MLRVTEARRAKTAPAVQPVGPECRLQYRPSAEAPWADWHPWHGEPPEADAVWRRVDARGQMTAIGSFEALTGRADYAQPGAAPLRGRLSKTDRFGEAADGIEILTEAAP